MWNFKTKFMANIVLQKPHGLAGREGICLQCNTAELDGPAESPEWISNLVTF